MLDFLDKADIIDEESYSALMLKEVEPYLEKKGREDFIFTGDNRRLHYEAYEKLLSRGSVVILHGFTESAEKFREMSYYFRKAGYSVFALELDGHGKSHRTSTKKEKVEIDSFDTYAEDLHFFIDRVVAPATKNGKIYIYSHSLGSTVTLLYLMQHPYIIEKAVLSSPMICGNMGMPVAVAGTVARLLCAVGGGKIPAPGRCVFDPEQSFENSDATSKARFEYYHEKRKKEPLYQTSGPSFGWVKASLDARDKLLDAGKITADALIFLPEEDKQLLHSYTKKFAEKADIKIKNVRNSAHEIFMSANEVLSWYIEQILDFFAG